MRALHVRLLLFSGLFACFDSSSVSLYWLNVPNKIFGSIYGPSAAKGLTLFCSILLALLYQPSYTKLFVINLLATEFFLLPSNYHSENSLHSFTWHGVFFRCLLFGTDFFLVLMFSGLRIEAPLLFTVQGNYIFTIFKAENQESQFLMLDTKPSIDKHKFLSFKGW